MFMQLLEKRRSIRKFSDQAVEPQKIQTLMEAALRSPTGRGINPWAFILVEDRDMLLQLSKAKQSGASFLQGAAAGIVVCADPAKSDTVVEDASIAAIIIQLAAESLGLGSCWVQMRDRMHPDGRPAQEHIARLLGIPADYMVQCVIALGYPAESKSAHARQSLDFDKAYKGQFGQKMFG
jgi:nitroreductase